MAEAAVEAAEVQGHTDTPPAQEAAVAEATTEKQGSAPLLSRETPEANTEGKPAGDDKPKSSLVTDGEGEVAAEGKPAESEDALAALPEEIRNKLEGYESMEDVLKDIERGRQAREGVPEKAEDYKVSTPEGMELEPNLANAFRELAHKAGLTQDQSDTLVGWWNEGLQKQRQVREDLRENTVTSLKKEWGDHYDSNLQAAQKAFKTFGSPELEQFLVETGFGDHPLVLKHFHRVGQAISEDALVTGDKPPSERPRTPGGQPMLSRPAEK